MSAFDVMFSRDFIKIMSYFPDDYRYLIGEIWAEIRELSKFFTLNKGISGIWKWPLFLIVYFLFIVISIMRIIVFPVSFLIINVKSHREFIEAWRNGLDEYIDDSIKDEI